MHARLIQNDVRELRQSIFDVLEPGVADDILGLPIIRLPKRRLIDPAGLLQHALAEAKGMEHFHRAAQLSAFPDIKSCIVEQKSGRMLLDDAALDVGKSG